MNKENNLLVTGSEKSLTETEYGITSKPRTSENRMSNAIVERIHQVLGNLVRPFNIQQSYVDKNYPWTGILADAAFAKFIVRAN